MKSRKKEIGLTKELYETIITIVDERVQSIKVSREDYEKLREAIYELAQAQRRTEERVESLAEAQRRTEERVERLEVAVEKLAEAQRRTEERVERLEVAVEKLAEAQRRTEERVERLEIAVEKLAEAQRRTETVVQQLAREVGALSDLIGYSLEDIARVVLPGYLERHFKVKIDELERRFFVVDSKEIEVNLYAEGEKEGKPLVVIGECKSRIYERDVESFYSSIEPLLKTIDKELILVLFGFLIHPSASKSAQAKNILLIASYQR